MDRSQPSELESVKQIARDCAFACGAAAVRVAAAHRDEEARDAMRAAFARGDHATWPFDETYSDSACTPGQLLPGARAIVCVAVSYATAAPAAGPLQGRVSNYAWSGDYHHRLKRVLRRIAKSIDDAVGAPVTVIACDTKPLAERAFAARAGLGWIGKHTNLINPTFGSFVFLGEVLTTLPLPPDEPLRKSCGTCSRCIPACPTGALRRDYTIDATRCISDLTQRKDAIPRDLRPFIGSWVWGCDLCQTACPPNSAAKSKAGDADQPLSQETAAPSLLALLRLRSGAFKRAYASSAMGWRGAAVLRRNAAVALGNALDRAAVPALCEALCSDPHPLVRGHVAWALGRIGSPEAIGALRTHLHEEQDPGVREELAAALEPFAWMPALQ